MLTRKSYLLLIVLIFGLLSCSANADSSREPIIAIYGGAGETEFQHALKSGVDMIFHSIHWYGEPGAFKSFSEKARKHGILACPSLAVGYDGNPKGPHEFAKAHPQYWEKRKDGSLVNTYPEIQLSWGYPEVRKFKVETIAKLVKESNCDGIFLDRCRFWTNKSGYSDIIVNEFKKKYNKDPFELPCDDPDWIKFRANYVTQFVAELREAFDKINPKLKIIACVHPPDPNECLYSNMEDWATWVEKGLLNGLATENFERDTNHIREMVTLVNKTIDSKVPHIPLFACWGGHLTTAEMFREASLKCLNAGAAGITIHRGDVITQLGLWKTVNEIAHWDLEEIASVPINYVLNSSFENGLENWAVGDGKNTKISGKTGKKSLAVKLPVEIGVSQLIDSGFPKNKTALNLSARVNTSALDSDAQAVIDLTINYQRDLSKLPEPIPDFVETRREVLYRIDIPAGKKQAWRPINADIAIENSDFFIKFIILNINATGSKGRLRIDEIALNFTDKKVDPRAYRYERPRKAALSVNINNINLVRGCLVTGSSYWKEDIFPHDVSYYYTNAVDGDLSAGDSDEGTTWLSDRPGQNQWLKFYLPKPYLITRIRLLNAPVWKDRTKDFKIEISSDDSRYHQIASGTLPNDATTWTEIKLKPTFVKYMKFIGLTGYRPDGSLGLKEIEIY